MSLLMFGFWTAIVLIILLKMPQKCSRKGHSNRYLNRKELKPMKHKVGIGAAKRIITFGSCIILQIILTFYFKMSVSLSGLVLICNFFRKKYFFHPYVYLLACFYKVHLNFLTSRICFHLGHCERCKQVSSKR